jgi:virginiamycin B lyase
VPDPPITPLEDVGAGSIEVRPHPDWIIAIDGRVWVTGVEPGIGVFEPGTGRRVGSVALTGGLCGAPDEGFGSVWFPACGPSVIHRVSLATQHVTASIPLELPPAGEFTIGAGEGGVWAVVEHQPASCRLIRVDPATDRVDDMFALPPGAVSVRAGHGSLWVACPTEDRVLRVDPRSGELTAEFTTGHVPRFLVVGQDGIWVLNQASGSVTHIDAISNRVLATIEVDGCPMKGGDIAIGQGSVWVRGTTELVAQIDPVSHTLVARLGSPTVGSASVAATDGELWVSAGAEGRLFRIPLPDQTSARHLSR